MKYIARQSSGWSQKTMGWYKTKWYIGNNRQRGWIEYNINGQWTENAFGEAYFEDITDAMAFKIRWGHYAKTKT